MSLSVDFIMDTRLNSRVKWGSYSAQCILLVKSEEFANDSITRKLVTVIKANTTSAV